MSVSVKKVKAQVVMVDRLQLGALESLSQPSVRPDSLHLLLHPPSGYFMILEMTSRK